MTLDIAALVQLLAQAVAGAIAGMLAHWYALRAALDWPRQFPPIRRAPAASVATAAAFVLIHWRWGYASEALAWTWLAAVGVALSIVDLRCRRLPFRLTAALVAGGALALFASSASWTPLLRAGTAALLVLALAGLVQLAAPSHTGGGDTALYGALALFLGYLGWNVLAYGLLFATIVTALVAVVVWARRGSGTSIPAGPSLIACTVLTVAFAA